jgi:glycosyltransferase involved in cell wall biosynthesis
MKIWLIQTGEDVPLSNNIRRLRTAVLADELAKRGHEVTWWAGAFSHFRKTWLTGKEQETLDNGVRAIFLRGTGYQKNVSLARIIDHRRVARQFDRLSREQVKPDIIVCSLPPYDLAYRVARFAKNHGIPLIMDARDYWPDIFVDAVPRIARPLARIALTGEFRQTRQAFRKADSITAMSEDVLAWALGYCERPRGTDDKVFHLGYRALPEDAAAAPDWLSRLDGKFIVAYIGTFSPNYGPGTLVAAAKWLLDAGREDIAIVIAGSGGDDQEAIRAEGAGLSNVTMPGWLEQEEISALLRRSSIGVCPANVDAKFFPNKTFLYFSAGIPVLSAYQGELRTWLDEKGLGSYYPSGDAEALAKTILQFCDDPNLRRRVGERVRQAFSENFDERVVYARFSDHIESCAGMDEHPDYVA